MFIPTADEENRPGATPYVVLFVLALNVTAFVVETQVLAGGDGSARTLFSQYGAVPSHLAHHPAGYWHTILSHMFLHASWMHVLGNMLFLWIFADNVEDLLGPVGFAFFYLACGLAAIVAQVGSDPQSMTPVVGASGAVSGVIGAYIVMFPRNTVRNVYWLGCLLGVPRLPAWLYLGFWFAMQLLLARSAASHGGGPGDVAFVAHVGGFIAGMVLVILFPRREEALDHPHWRRSRAK